MVMNIFKSVSRIRKDVIYITYSSAIAVLTGILAQISFYLGPVPYTMQNVGIVFSGLFLPPSYALFSQLLYLILIGLGLPLAAGFKGGIHVLLGYTGGYLVSFPISSLIMSILSRMYLKKKGLRLSEIGLKEYFVLLFLSFIAILPTYVLGYLVFTHYALQNEKLFLWASRTANTVGVSGDSLLILFIATVVVFIPQDLFMDHVLAIYIATIFTQFLESRGIRIE